MTIEEVVLSEEELNDGIRSVCLEEPRLAKILRGKDLLFHVRHKTKKEDFMPGQGANYCSTTGVLTSNVEYDHYKEIYCKIEADSEICKSESKESDEPEETDESGKPDEPDEPDKPAVEPFKYPVIPMIVGNSMVCCSLLLFIVVLVLIFRS